MCRPRQTRNAQRAAQDRHLRGVLQRWTSSTDGRRQPQTIGYVVSRLRGRPPPPGSSTTTSTPTTRSPGVRRRQPSGNLTRDHILDNITFTGLWAQHPRRPRCTGRPTAPDAPAAGGRPSPLLTIPVRLQDVPGPDLADAAQLGRREEPERQTQSLDAVDKVATSPPEEELELSASELRRRVQFICADRRRRAARTKSHERSGERFALLGDRPQRSNSVAPRTSAKRSCSRASGSSCLSRPAAPSRSK